MNCILAEMCKEKNIYLIDYYLKIKLHHLNRGKLRLNKKGSTVLSNTFIGKLLGFLTDNLKITLAETLRNITLMYHLMQSSYVFVIKL